MPNLNLNPACPICKTNTIINVRNGYKCKTCNNKFEVGDLAGELKAEILVSTPTFKLETNTDKTKYVATYFNTVIKGDIRCPKCDQLLFKNYVIRGSCEHKCKRCKTIVRHNFM